MEEKIVGYKLKCTEPVTSGGLCFQCVRFHANCNYVLTGSEDRSVRVWDLLNGQCVRQFNGHKVWHIIFLVQFWLTCFAPCSTLCLFKGSVHSVEWSPDGKLVASGGEYVY